MRSRIATALILGVAALAAGEPATYSWAQLQGGFLRQDNADCVDHASVLGLSGGHWLERLPGFGWEATYAQSRLEGFSGLWKAKEQHLDGGVLYRPWVPRGGWVPFLRAGLGFSRLEAPLSLSGSDSTRLNLQAALGAHVPLGQRFLGSLELRGTSIRTSTVRTEVALLAGVGLRWGRTAPVPPAPIPASAEPAPEAAPKVEPAPMPEPAPVPVSVPEPAPIAPPDPQPAPQPPPPPAKIVLDEAVLHFPNNGSDLGPEARQAVVEVAERLKAFAGAYALVVSGHTSSLGPKAHNRALSLKRAEAVAKVLVEAGIPADRITVLGKGPDEPIADNATRQGQSRNRRVEIDLRTVERVEKVRRETSTVEGGTPTKP